MSNLDQNVNLERVQVLDVLRGFALLGILLINAMSILAVNGSTPAFTVHISPAERFLQDAILFFVESKFFTLFSLLFGIGFAIQIQSAERQGTGFLPRISRRMLGLFLFGLLHILLFWDGDILVIYAITGSLLILFRNLSGKAIRRWVIALLAIPSTLTFIAWVGSLVARTSPSGASNLATVDKTLEAEFANTQATQQLLQSSFVQAIAIRIETYIQLLPLLLSRIPTVLAMFLIGLYLGRSKFITKLPENVETLKKVRLWCLSIGFVVMTLILAGTKFLPTSTALIGIIEDQYLAGPILCLGYAAALTLAFLKNPNRRIFGAFAPVGRMALTNYISQSVVLTFLSYGWGLGFALQLGGYQVLGICIALFVAQVIFSRMWLAKFSFGPLEWIWRCITYWKVLPLRSTSKI